MSNYPGRDPVLDPITRDEVITLLSHPEWWPARANGVAAQRMIGLKRNHGGTLEHGVLVNVPHRDRLTVYMLGMYDPDVWKLVTVPDYDVTGAKYEGYEALYDDGWTVD